MLLNLNHRSNGENVLNFSSDSWPVEDVNDDERNILLWVNDLEKDKELNTVIGYLRGVIQVVQRHPDIPVIEWGQPQINTLLTVNTRPRTKRAYLAACRSLLRFYRDHGLGESPHMRQWNRARMRLRGHNAQLLTHDEVADLLIRLQRVRRNGANKHIAALLAAYWGLRAREIAWLTCADVLLGKRIVILIKHGKRDKSREVSAVHVPDAVDEAIRVWWLNRMRGTADVTNQSYCELTLIQIERSIAKVLRKMIQPNKISYSSTDHAHIEWADSIHLLRHWYANRLHQLEVSISDISRLLGHSSPRTTINSYLHQVHLPTIRHTALAYQNKTCRYFMLNQISTLSGVSVVRVRTVAKANGIAIQNGLISVVEVTRLLTHLLREAQCKEENVCTDLLSVSRYSSPFQSSR
ncbi:MAG: tyrosine-type recombinase/integrase [Anaerolineae bacterium]|nr:tyrosine-type recombinase/integrase [Anaerolineae bacterium]